MVVSALKSTGADFVTKLSAGVVVDPPRVQRVVGAAADPVGGWLAVSLVVGSAVGSAVSRRSAGALPVVGRRSVVGWPAQVAGGRLSVDRASP